MGSEGCAQMRCLQQQRQEVRRNSTTCRTPSVDQQLLETKTVEEVPAPLVQVKSNTATAATVQTDPSARRRRRTTWRTRDTSPSRRKPKTTSTPMARCTVMCII